MQRTKLQVMASLTPTRHRTANNRRNISHPLQLKTVHTAAGIVGGRAGTARAAFALSALAMRPV